MDNERLILPIGLKSTVEGVGMNESVDHNEAAGLAWTTNARICSTFKQDFIYPGYQVNGCVSGLQQGGRAS